MNEDDTQPTILVPKSSSEPPPHFFPPRMSTREREYCELGSEVTSTYVRVTISPEIARIPKPQEFLRRLEHDTLHQFVEQLRKDGMIHIDYRPSPTNPTELRMGILAVPIRDKGRGVLDENIFLNHRLARATHKEMVAVGVLEKARALLRIAPAVMKSGDMGVLEAYASCSREIDDALKEVFAKA